MKLGLIFFIFILSINAQVIIKGKIFDSASNSVIEYTNIYLANTGYGAASDQYGEYEIRLVPAGKYILTVSYAGYITQTKNINLSPDSLTVVYNFYLQEDTLSSAEVLVEADRYYVKPLTYNQIIAKHNIRVPKKVNMLKPLPQLRAINFLQIEQEIEEPWYETYQWYLVGAGAAIITIFAIQ